MVQERDHILKSIRYLSVKENLFTHLMDIRGTKGLSHSIFEIFSEDDHRSLDGVQVGAVSSWALDELLNTYERRQADFAAEFCEKISRLPWARSLRGRVMERQLLKYR
jgi:hypothetical protein